MSNEINLSFTIFKNLEVIIALTAWSKSITVFYADKLQLYFLSEMIDSIEKLISLIPNLIRLLWNIVLFLKSHIHVVYACTNKTVCRVLLIYSHSNTCQHILAHWKIKSFLHYVCFCLHNNDDYYPAKSEYWIIK
jgi:hypothetical protein